MQKINTPEQMRLLDAYMIEKQGIPGVVLMEHAAAGVVGVVLGLLRPGQSVGILCGMGNNGADGLSVLRQLDMRGVTAWAALLGQPERLTGDARLQYDMAVRSGLDVRLLLCEADCEALPWAEAGVLVDALFGTGLSRGLTGLPLQVVQRINAANKPVIAVDIPSGVHGATGQVLGDAVRASCTVAIQNKKIGHMLFPGRACAGEVTVIPIGPQRLNLYEAEELEAADIQALLPKREKNSHKGMHGRGLLLAGSEKYMGAACMSANAALRAGIGLLRAVVPNGLRAAFAPYPAVIAVPVGGADVEWTIEAAEETLPLIAGNDALAVGPGMGREKGVAFLVEAALKSALPVVIDADGLNAMAENRELLKLLSEKAVLTPHPGEMGRLLQKDAAQITMRPLEYAKQAAMEWGCTVLLKGASSIIACPTRVCVNISGNAGLAKGGSGDVLTGILLALMAQGLQPYEAACVGAYLLGIAADQAFALLGERMLLPTDIIEVLAISDTQAT